MNKDHLWRALKSTLEIEMPKNVQSQIIPHSYIDNIDEEDRIVTLAVPSQYAKNIAEERAYPYIRDSVKKMVGDDFRVAFTIVSKEPEKIAFDEMPLFSSSIAEQLQKEEEENSMNLILNKDYNFERYIVGGHNRLAYAVSTAIANDPGKVYNPFFLYSKVGLGKTHLIQAIASEAKKRDSSLKVIYKAGTQFLHEVVEAVRYGRGAQTNQASKLRDEYESADIVIIDDIHVIAGKNATQEEFFKIFNVLFMRNKQIILTSDRPPQEIKSLQERLSSRFASGMIADIVQPDFETKLAILQARNSEDKSIDLPLEILEYIANVVDTNIRELEGKLIQIKARIKLENREISKSVVEEYLGVYEKQRSKKITPAQVIKEVCNYYGVTIKEVKGKRRTKNIALARQICMFILRDILDLGYQAIGANLGDRDHSTIIHGVTKVETMLKADKNLKTELDEIKNIIRTRN